MRVLWTILYMLAGVLMGLGLLDLLKVVEVGDGQRLLVIGGVIGLTLWLIDLAGHQHH